MTTDPNDVLRAHGITGIEVAPTKVWPKPLDATDAETVVYRRWWEDRGFRIVAAQSLLFGRPDLTVFGPPEIYRQTLDYLGGIVRLCARLGAEALVFGSPKNRRRGDLSRLAAWPTAVAFTPSAPTAVSVPLLGGACVKSISVPGSMSKSTVPPGFSLPSRSPASIMPTAMRSFTEPPGFFASTLTASTPGPGWKRPSFTSGVLPSVSRMFS